jgi:hypothetical protein
MNKNGNPATLVAAQPGNTNAVKYGVHSPRYLEPRAAEIVEHLTESFEFTVAQRVAVEQAARCIAILDAIDRDLDERGVVGKRGEPRYLLKDRSRHSRELERWLALLAPTMERQSAGDPTEIGRADYIAELQRIATGRDSTARARDRISASRELLKIESTSKTETAMVTLHVHRSYDGDMEILEDSPGGPGDGEVPADPD